MNKKLSLILLLCVSVNLAGCITWIKSETSTEVPTIQEHKSPLAIRAPDPIKVVPPEWKVITPENADAVFAELKKTKQEAVLIATTPNGYKQLSITIAELRQLIDTQRQLIIQYQIYYEKIPSPAK